MMYISQKRLEKRNDIYKFETLQLITSMYVNNYKYVCYLWTFFFHNFFYDTIPRIKD